MLRLALSTCFVLVLSACAASVPLEQHNTDVALANTQIVAANSTARSIGSTATALAPRLETAEAGYVAMATAAETAKTDAEGQRRYARGLVRTITASAPTATPPCPEGQVITSNGVCGIPTQTPVPTRTVAPTPTLTKAQSPKASGVYLVGSEIAPGYWRGANPRATGCYWAIYSSSGNLADNYFGSCASLMFVPDWATSVEISEGSYRYCGDAASNCPVVQ